MHQPISKRRYGVPQDRLAGLHTKLVDQMSKAIDQFDQVEHGLMELSKQTDDSKLDHLISHASMVKLLLNKIDCDDPDVDKAAKYIRDFLQVVDAYLGAAQQGLQLSQDTA